HHSQWQVARRGNVGRPPAPHRPGRLGGDLRSHSGGGGMNLNRVGIIYRKELIDTLRDRRTIISTIVLPILMFPLLTLGFGFVAEKSMQKVEREGSTIMLLGETNAPALARTIRQTGGIRVVAPSEDYV